MISARMGGWDSGIQFLTSIHYFISSFLVRDGDVNLHPALRSVRVLEPEFVFIVQTEPVLRVRESHAKRRRPRGLRADRSVVLESEVQPMTLSTGAETDLAGAQHARGPVADSIFKQRL